MVKRGKRYMIIARVRQSKKSKQKTVTIPKHAGHKIRAGDYIEVRRIRRKG